MYNNVSYSMTFIMRYITPFLLALILLGAGCMGAVETDGTAQVATPPVPEPEPVIEYEEVQTPQAAVEVLSKEEYQRRLEAGEL
jgi:hypothetical protein